jgi:hypothetical protein
MYNNRLLPSAQNPAMHAPLLLLLPPLLVLLTAGTAHLWLTSAHEIRT